MGPQVCSSLDKHNFAMQLIIKGITNSKLVQNIDYEFWVDKSQP